jgi:hypothetical protein
MVRRCYAYPNKRIAALMIMLFLLSLTSHLATEQGVETNVSKTKSASIENLRPVGSLSPSMSDSWTCNDYILGIEGIFDTFNYFNLSKYGGGWQYEVTREWTDAAFTNGKYLSHDAECIVGLLSAYNLTGDEKYLRYAEDIWNWDQRFFLDDVYGGYYVRLNQDNSIAIGDKGMFEHGWFGLATAQLYYITENLTYLNQVQYIYDFVTSNFYDSGDGSYYGALSRNLGIIVSDVDTNWCAPFARFLMAAYIASGNSTYGDMAIELVDNLMNHAYDSQFGWIVNRVSSDWSSFSNTAKGWYDVLQTFIDAYRVFGNSAYLAFAKTCFNDIQQANSTAGYLREMNRDWTSSVNDELLGEEDPGVAIAYLRIANALQNSSILQEAYRYKDAIYAGLHDPVYGGIYRRIYSSGSQSTWKQWCGAGRVMEMLSEFALPDEVQRTSVLVWGDADPNGQERAGRTIAENLEDVGLNVTFVSDFNELEQDLLATNYSTLVLVAMPWSDAYSNIPTSTENLIESLVGNGELGLVGFHDIIWQGANNPVLENIFGGTLSSFIDRDSTYSVVNSLHPIVQGLPGSFPLDDDQLLRGSWDGGVEVIMEADYLNTPVVVTNEYDGGRSVYIAAGGGSGYSSAIVNNDTNLVRLYQNAVFWSCNTTHESETPPSNMALYFDGSDEVIIPSDSSLNPTNALTVMAWIHADDWVGNQRIVQKGVDDQYRLLDEGNLEFGLAGVSGGDIGTPLPTTGTWHHVAGTYDGLTIRLYIDGVERVSNSASGPLQTSSTSLYIGNKPLSSYPGDCFKGIIDEVRIYNRALSDQEINNTMYNASPATSGLVLYLSFDVLHSSTCPDSSGYGNDGTNYGAEIVPSFDWDEINPSLEYPTVPEFENLPASIATDTFTVNWNESTVSGYTILYYELQIDSSAGFSNPDEYTAYTTSCELTDLLDGTYYLRVRAVDERLIRSEWSSVSTISVDLPDISYPTIPEFVSLSSVVNTSIYLVEWTESEVDGASIAYYELEVDITGGFPSPSQYVSVSTSFELNNLVNGTYYLRVRAVDNEELRSGWSATGVLTVEIPPTVPVNEILPVPTFHQHPLGVTTSYFSVAWSLPSSYDENDFVYEVEISNDADFSDASLVTADQTMQYFSLNREDWYYLRVRSVHDSQHSDWSEITRIAGKVSELSIDGFESLAIVENNEDPFVIWTIDSYFYFNYSIEMSGEIQDFGYYREENVTLSVADLAVGEYYIRLTVVDVVGREYQSETVLHIVQDFSEVLSVLGRTSLLGLVLLVGGIIVYAKHPHNKWKAAVKSEVETKGTVPLESLATSCRVAMTKLATYLASTEFALVTTSGTVCSTEAVLNRIRSELLHKSSVEISELFDELGLDRDEFIALILKHSEEFILTENLIYMKDMIVENLRERLLTSNSLDTDSFYEETGITSITVESLLPATNLRYYPENDRVFKCIDYEGLRIINQAIKNGFAFVNEVLENTSVPLKQLNAFLSLRREDVVYSSALGLLVSTKWLSDLRKTVFKERDIEIEVLANNYSIEPDKLLSILQYFLQGQVSPDKQKFSIEQRKKETPIPSQSTRWNQPSLRSVYLSSPPPTGMRYQAPVIKAGESGGAKCVQTCGCIWLPISLILIFITPFGSAAIAVTAMLGFLWKYLSDSAQKNPSRAPIKQETGRELPDGRFVCPYCSAPREYVAEEMNDRGSVYCKECRAVFPLRSPSDDPSIFLDTSSTESASISDELSIPRIAELHKIKEAVSKRNRGLMLLGVIGVGLIVISYVLQYYSYLLLIDIDSVEASGIVSVASSSIDMIGSLLLACGLFALRERYREDFFLVGIIVLTILPLRFAVGQILFSSIGMSYIIAIYSLHFLKFLFIGLGILRQRTNSKYPSLWNMSWAIMVVWGIVDSFIPFILGGVYTRSVIDIFYIPGIIINIVSGFALTLIFLSELDVLNPTPIVRYMKKTLGFITLVSGLGLLSLGLLSWAVYIPVFSESWLGEILGSITIVVGWLLISNRGEA